MEVCGTHTDGLVRLTQLAVRITYRPCTALRVPPRAGGCTSSLATRTGSAGPPGRDDPVAALGCALRPGLCPGLKVGGTGAEMIHPAVRPAAGPHPPHAHPARTAGGRRSRSPRWLDWPSAAAYWSCTGPAATCRPFSCTTTAPPTATAPAPRDAPSGPYGHPQRHRITGSTPPRGLPRLPLTRVVGGSQAA